MKKLKSWIFLLVLLILSGCASEETRKEQVDLYIKDLNEEIRSTNYVIGNAGDFYDEYSLGWYIFADPDDFIAYANELSGEFQKAADRLRGISTNNHPDLEEAHEVVMLSADELEYFALNIADSVENDDTDLHLECYEALTESKDLMERAQKKIKKAKGYDFQKFKELSKYY